MALEEYRRKRRFNKTPEPRGEANPRPPQRLYVIQKHAASHLHYDLRLEMDGVLKSWAVPKGPSLKPGEKHLAVQVEDHPVEYAGFEGIIPQGQYGGGTVMVWDRGTWEPRGDFHKDLEGGHLKFILNGEKLKGSWVLVRTGYKGEGKNWLLIKEKDDYAPKDPSLFSDQKARSAASGRTMEEIAQLADRVWDSNSPRGGDLSQPGQKPLTDLKDLSGLPGARRAPFPEKITPQMTLLIKEPPEGDQWVHEIKFDGYRIMALKKDSKVRLISRNGKEWTHRFPSIAQSLETLPVYPLVLDGEVVIMGADGTSDFQALQNNLKGRQIGRLSYYVFDLPYWRDFDLSRTPLMERKNILARVLSLIPPSEPIRLSDHILGQGASIYELACQHGLEGIVSKRIDSPYLQKRTGDWLKTKCSSRQEFVIVGFTQPAGARTGFGALLLGYYTPSKTLIYAGRVGTGFTEESLKILYEKLQKNESQTSPLSKSLKGRESKGVRWVYPHLVAEVEFRAWSADGILRQPSFKGLREDKLPGEVLRESPAPPREATSAVEALRIRGGGQPSGKGSDSIAGVRLTHPDKILFSDQGITKAQLAGYYEQVGPWILPHIIQRPLTIVRCPSGRQKCFYQKNLTEELPAFLKGVPIPGKDEKRTYIMIEDLAGLISLVQIGVLEIHPWPSRSNLLEYPDRMIFDMDPDPAISSAELLEGCHLLRDRLQILRLRSFIKTSGGKGFHLVVPLLPKNHWQEVKEFAKAVAESLVKSYPKRFVATMSKTRRKNKIYVDYLRNNWEATAVAAFSTRARPGAPVSTPLGWEELTENLKPDGFTIENLPSRLAKLKEDPWAELFSTRQSLKDSLKKRL